MSILFWILLFVVLLVAILLIRCILRYFDGKYYLTAGSRFQLSCDRSTDQRNHIICLIMLDSEMTFDAFRSFIEPRVKCLRPFTSKIVIPKWFGCAHYADPSSFDIVDHLEEHRLPPHATHEHLQLLISMAQSEPLDPSLPMWQMTLVHGVPKVGSETETGCVVLMKWHHCIADGVAGVKLLFHMTDKKKLPETPVAAKPKKKHRGVPIPPRPGCCKWTIDALRMVAADVTSTPDPSGMALSNRGGTKGEVCHVNINRCCVNAVDRKYAPPARPSAPKDVDDPDTEGEEAVETEGLVHRSASFEVLDFVVPSAAAEPPVVVDVDELDESVMKIEEGPLDKIPDVFTVDAIKRVAHATNVTFNDVVTSAVAGGCRAYLLKHGTEYDLKMINDRKETDLRTFAWMNIQGSFPKLLKELNETDSYRMTSDDLHVNAGLVVQHVPVHVSSHVERMKLCNDDLRKLFYTPSPYINGILMRLIGCLPMTLASIVSVGLAKSSMSISNVPGPRHPREFAGVEIEGLWFAASPLGGASQMVTLFSYKNHVSFAIAGVKGEEMQGRLYRCIANSFKEHFAVAPEEVEE